MRHRFQREIDVPLGKKAYTMTPMEEGTRLRRVEDGRRHDPYLFIYLSFSLARALSLTRRQQAILIHADVCTSGGIVEIQCHVALKVSGRSTRGCQ